MRYYCSQVLSLPFPSLASYPSHRSSHFPSHSHSPALSQRIHLLYGALLPQTTPSTTHGAHPRPLPLQAPPLFPKPTPRHPSPPRHRPPPNPFFPAPPLPSSFLSLSSHALLLTSPACRPRKSSRAESPTLRHRLPTPAPLPSTSTPPIHPHPHPSYPPLLSSPRAVAAIQLRAIRSPPPLLRPPSHTLRLPSPPSAPLRPSELSSPLFPVLAPGTLSPSLHYLLLAPPSSYSPPPPTLHQTPPTTHLPSPQPRSPPRSSSEEFSS